jgi:hypothetical protein
VAEGAEICLSGNGQPGNAEVSASMILRIGTYLLFLSVISFPGCREAETGDMSEKPLAKAGTELLYFSDLPQEIQQRAKGHDSLSFLKVYINDWLNQQVLLGKAKQHLDELVPGIEKKVQDYRNSLIIYEYQKAFMEQYLDTSVSDEEARLYYEANQKNFELKRNIVRLRYVKLPKESGELVKARKWFLSEDASDRLLLLDYCEKNATNAFFDEDSWLSFDDILKEIPVKSYDDEVFLSNNKFVELTDNDFIYWVFIRSFRIKNSISPYELEESTIRNIIINQRKVKLLQEMEGSLIREASQKNEITWYIE